MSLKKAFLSFFILALGLGVGAGLMFLKDKTLASRHIASDPSSWRPTGLGKHLAPITVQILMPEKMPDRDDQEIELTGYVTLNSATDSDLNFRWFLPEGVSLVDGESEDAWSNVQVGQTAVTKISVIGFSKENRKVISLEGFVQMGDHRLGNSSTLVSSDLGSVEKAAPKMMRMKQMEEQDSEKSRRSR